MSKLMSVLGIVLLAIGAALALVGLVSPAQMQVYGLTIETAAILIVGGILSIGQGAILASTFGMGIAPAATMAEAAADAPEAASAPAVAPVPELPEFVPQERTEEAPARVRFPGFGRRPAAAAAAVAVGSGAMAAQAGEAAASSSSAVDDTIAALEQAKADIANAIGGVNDIASDSVEHVAEVEEEEDVEAAPTDGEEGELYVLEEREIRGRPARILSDHTVEAETDEGWMRFENLEHLNEYLDASGEPA